MATTQTPPSQLPTGKIFVPLGTDVSVGCVVKGGFADAFETEVKVIDIKTITTSIPNVPNSTIQYLEVTLNQLPWQSAALPSGVVDEGFNTSSSMTRQTLGYTSILSFHCMESTYELVDSFSATQTISPKTVSFKETAKGWVSFKSFYPDIALSMANDYYTLFRGNLYVHHAETSDRNTFYSDVLDFPFIPSSIDVVLNDNASIIKEFNTLNYEGSQAKVNKFVYEENLEIPEQPDTSYDDQSYYNLSEKDGWNVSSIITNDEDGYIDEFLEKEGKWFNNIKREVDLSLEKADTSDFSFQGIGFMGSAPVVTRPGGTTTTTTTTTTTDNGDELIDDRDKPVDDKLLISGCTDPESTNYNPEATIDDGSCYYLGDNACNTIATAGEACADYQNFLTSDSSPFGTKEEVADYWAGYFNSLPEGYRITTLQMLEQLENCCGGLQTRTSGEDIEINY